eukprot:Lithocolla_globosa_v1_NODE_6052_length_1143_cov_22.414522.p2 type:complete len:103 gc:universal NODE_6052_length_1143_cov_22.414522:261-569(+)
MYWSPYSNTANTLQNRYNNINNDTVPRITSFYENINNKRLQPFDYNTSTGNEWLTIKDRLKGHVSSRVTISCIITVISICSQVVYLVISIHDWTKVRVWMKN